MILCGGAQVFLLFVHLVHIKHDFCGGSGQKFSLCLSIWFTLSMHYLWGGGTSFNFVCPMVGSEVKHDFSGGGTSFRFVCPFGSH